MKKALIVDDSALARMLILRSLEPMQYECVQAENGEIAVERMKNESFDVVFMDWNMPILQGIEAVQEIRKSGNHTPIIMVSGLKDEIHIQQAQEAGANGFITKPFKEEEFRSSVMDIMETASVAN